MSDTAGSDVVVSVLYSFSDIPRDNLLAIANVVGCAVDYIALRDKLVEDAGVPHGLALRHSSTEGKALNAAVKRLLELGY